MIKLKKSLELEATAPAVPAAKPKAPAKPAAAPRTRTAARQPEAPTAPPPAGKENQPWALPGLKVTLPVKTPRPPLKKPKLIRESFTFPERDYALLDVLKEQAMMAGREVKKSELLRAGLAALIAMSNKSLIKTLDKVERIKKSKRGSK